jgi:hypothetical protein
LSGGSPARFEGAGHIASAHPPGRTPAQAFDKPEPTGEKVCCSRHSLIGKEVDSSRQSGLRRRPAGERTQEPTSCSISPTYLTLLRYGLDYGPAEYQGHQELAEEALREDLVGLMRARTPVFLDLSFWQRAARDRYKALIVEHGLRLGPGLPPGVHRDLARAPTSAVRAFRRQRGRRHLRLAVDDAS